MQNQAITREDINTAIGQVTMVASFLLLYQFSDPVLSLGVTILFVSASHQTNNDRIRAAMTGGAMGSMASFFPNAFHRIYGNHGNDSDEEVSNQATATP